MKISDMVNDFKAKNISNTKIAPNAISEYLNKVLKIRTYIPFNEKKQIVTSVVEANVYEDNGVKKIKEMSQYVSFVIAMILAHTDLEVSDSPIDDYDLLCASGLLGALIEEFKSSYDECSVLLNMAVNEQLEDNNLNIVIARFLNGILDRLDGLGGVLKDAVGNLNLNEFLGGQFNEDDINKLKGFLDRQK